VTDFLVFLIQGIPEAIGILSLSLALAGVSLRWKQVTILGILLAIIIFMIRLLPLATGLHTIAGLLINIFVLIKLTRIPLTKSFMVVLISIFTLAIVEYMIHWLFLQLSSYDPSLLMSRKILWAVLGLPQAIIMITLAVLAARLVKPKPNMWKVWADKTI